MTGSIFCIGVGPGDPELITIKAIKAINNCDVIYVPGKSLESSLAYNIASSAIPEISTKTLVLMNVPMTGNREVFEAYGKENACIIMEYANKGLNVAYLTLGDPTIYSSFTYINKHLDSKKYDIQYISGITSFCAGAAKLNISLADYDEEIRIMPGLHLDESNIVNAVIMKSGSKINDIKKYVNDNYAESFAVEKCGMEGEKTFGNINDVPDDIGYLTTIIAKKGK